MLTAAEVLTALLVGWRQAKVGPPLGLAKAMSG
jgi:hypothetical protein